MARDPNLNNESAEPLIRAHSVDSLGRSQSLDDQLLVSVLPEELLKNCKVDKWSSDEIKAKFDEITKVILSKQPGMSEQFRLQNYTLFSDAIFCFVQLTAFAFTMVYSFSEIKKFVMCMQIISAHCLLFKAVVKYCIENYDFIFSEDQFTEPNSEWKIKTSIDESELVYLVNIELKVYALKILLKTKYKINFCEVVDSEGRVNAKLFEKHFKNLIADMRHRQKLEWITIL